MNARQPIGINATSPAAIERAAQLWSDRQAASNDDEDYQHITLKLGCAEVDVEYVMIAGCPLVQGATINGEFVDVDCFAKSVGAGWRRDIERVLHVGE